MAAQRKRTRLQPTSPARDTGDNSQGYATDQRGVPFARVFGTSADIGAFEFNLPDSIFANGFD